MKAARVAFYAPMKAPDHPVPSGDRQIARLTLRALQEAGFAPRTVSDLRIFDGRGDAAAQAAMHSSAVREADRLSAELAANRPALWFTYHCHYKAPDLVGPAVSERLGIPYAISEPSISPRRREGPWAGFAAASEAAIASANCLFWTTGRDRPALEAAGHGPRMVHLPAFVDPAAEVPPRPAAAPMRLLTVAMMREGDKLESYRRLAAALAQLHEVDWCLDVVGDGPARPQVEAFFAGLSGRVAFHGTGDDVGVRRACERADLMVWPGVGEGVGMVYLEAQAAGLPVVSEDHAAQADLVYGRRAAPEDPGAFADAIRSAAADRQRLGQSARAAIMERHSLAAAARILRTALTELMP